MSLIYNVAILLYGLIIKVISPFNAKAKKWIVGRKNWAISIKDFSSKNNKPVIWIHAASLGEFEQGRPIIESINRQYPGWSIVLSFFSPSGYEIRRNYDQVEFVTYLPLDTKSNAKLFIETINPRIAIFVKYEFWLNYLSTLQEKSIPHYLVSGIFRDNQHFFKGYGRFFRDKLKGFERLYVQDNNSNRLLSSIGIVNVEVSGDTRFDRVLQIKNSAKQLPIIKKFTEAHQVIIVGSSWPNEEEQILSFIKNNHERRHLKFIIAPHEIEVDRINKFIKSCTCKVQKYSSVKSEIGDDVGVLIIDSIGILSSVYAFSDIAIVGGGFDAGIHNVLEAAVWEQPVLFGPNHQQFREAKGLISKNGGLSYSDFKDLSVKLSSLLDNPNLLQEMSQRAGDYCKSESGATEIIMTGLRKKLIDDKLVLRN